jgi:ParB family chromosome partitioning protein
VNIQRYNLNAIDEAQAYRRLTDEFLLTQDQIADAVGKGVALMNLQRDVQRALVQVNDIVGTTGGAGFIGRRNIEQLSHAMEEAIITYGEQEASGCQQRQAAK